MTVRPSDGRINRLITIQSLGEPQAAGIAGPALFTAIQEQLGLKLESTKGAVEVLVIDHVEQPSEN